MLYTLLNRDLCEKVNFDGQAWIGLKKSSGEWYKSDGTPATSNFQYTWYPSYPTNSDEYDYMMMYCGNNNNSGKIINYVNHYSRKFICQYLA